MGSTSNFVPMVGSSLPKVQLLRERGALNPNKTLEVVIHLHTGSEPPSSANGEDVDAVVAYLTAAGFENIVAIPHQCMLTAQGQVSQINAAFGVELQKFEFRRGSFFGHHGDIHLPAGLVRIVESVTGLDNLSSLSPIRDQVTSPHDQLTEERYDPAPMSVPLPPDYRLHFPAEVATLYDFPDKFDGTGETIAIVSIGGNFDPLDIRRYFDAQNLPTPDIQVERVGRPQPTTRAANMHDLELTMGLQVVGSVAPGAKLVVFSVAADTPQPFLAVLKQAMWHRQHQPSIVSISYGNAEGLFREQDLKAANRVFAAATQQGITICAASGDAGSASRDYDSMPPPPATHVNFPASSPFVLACGGTSIQTADGRITSERVWNDHDQCRLATAGGISRVFERPDYQRGLNLPKNRSDWRGFDGRGLPDVAINACLTSGYRILFQGKWLPNGGTSAAAPLWAGLIARLNQALGRRLGFVHPYLYRLAGTPAFRDITQGNNGFYKAGAGWDACTGNGVPVGRELLAALQREIGTADATNNQQASPPAPQRLPIELTGSLLAARQAALLAASAAQHAQRITHSLRRP